MAITNGYATVAQFAERYLADITAGALTTATNQIEQIIQAVSRKIDETTSTQFYASSANVVRYFQSEYPCKLFIDDLKTLVSIEVDTNADGVYETTLTSSDYLLMPANHLPYQWIEVTPWATNIGRWPAHAKSVKITGTWGNDQSWATDLVREACLLQSWRIYKRSGAPFGVVGGGELGTVTAIPGVDPDVKAMLEPVSRRLWWG